MGIKRKLVSETRSALFRSNTGNQGSADQLRLFDAHQ